MIQRLIKTNHLPGMPLKKVSDISEVIGNNKYKRILELGTKHGVSTRYFALAMERHFGGGEIVTMDLPQVKSLKPNVKDLFKEWDIFKEVKLEVFMENSYTWQLMKFLEKGVKPFDFCYIDGSHLWEIDGFSFFLVDKLLKPGGCIVFDDLDWRLALSSCWKQRDSLGFKFTKQVRKVWELLVKTHPDYHNFKEVNGQGFAFKKRDLKYLSHYGTESGSELILKNIHKDSNVSDYIEVCQKAIEMTKEAGINATALIMIGNRGETMKTVLQTRGVLKQYKPTSIHTFCGVYLLPQTALFQQAKRRKLIDDDCWLDEERTYFYPHPWWKLLFWHLIVSSVRFNVIKRMIMNFIMQRQRVGEFRRWLFLRMRERFL